MKKKALILLMAACVLPSTGFAGQQYKGAVDFGCGPSVGYYSVSGEAKNALGTAFGNSSFIRYTHYLKNGFGIFGELRGISATAEADKYFCALNKADGGKYRYRFDYRYYNQGYDCLLSLGGAYRFVWDNFDVVFRAGLGWGERTNNFCYERMAREGSGGPEYFEVSTFGSVSDADYLISSGTQYFYAQAFVVSGSAQFVLKTRKSIFFFGEIGLDASPSRYTAKSIYYASKNGYNATNWVESVAYSDYKDYWTVDNASKKVTYPKYGMGAHLNITFGIGFNLWRTK